MCKGYVGVGGLKADVLRSITIGFVGFGEL